MVRDGLDALGAARPHGREGAPRKVCTGLTNAPCTDAGSWGRRSGDDADSRWVEADGTVGLGCEACAEALTSLQEVAEELRLEKRILL